MIFWLLDNKGLGKIKARQEKMMKKKSLSNLAFLHDLVSLFLDLLNEEHL